MYEVEPSSDGVPRLVQGASADCASSAAITGGDAVTVTDELGEESASFSTGAVLDSGAPRPVQA